jgi:hypothetical protein
MKNDYLEIACPICGYKYRIKSSKKNKNYYCTKCLRHFKIGVDTAESNDKFGEIAIHATELLQDGVENDPRSAWGRAVQEIFDKKKRGPFGIRAKEAYLGLCEEGEVEGVAPGDYTQSKEDKKVALTALKLLRENPELAKSSQKLWRLVEPQKREKGQISVVIALWNEGIV